MTCEVVSIAGSDSGASYVEPTIFERQSHYYREEPPHPGASVQVTAKRRAVAALEMVNVKVGHKWATKTNSGR